MEYQMEKFNRIITRWAQWRYTAFSRITQWVGKALAIPPPLPTSYSMLDFSHFMRREIFHYSRLYARNRVKIVGSEHLLKALEKSPVVIVSLHHGSWILIGGALVCNSLSIIQQQAIDRTAPPCAVIHRPTASVAVANDPHPPVFFVEYNALDHLPLKPQNLRRDDRSHNVVPPRVLENPRRYTISGMSVISFLRRICRKSQKTQTPHGRTTWSGRAGERVSGCWGQGSVHGSGKSEKSQLMIMEFSSKSAAHQRSGYFCT
jgi:hypothetical protein